MFDTILQSLRDDDRGVSEIIGYGFIFAAVLATVVFLSIASTPIIDQTESEQAMVTMEQNLDQLDKEIRNIEFGMNEKFYRAEYPAGQFGQTGKTEITVEHDGDPDPVMVIETRPLKYQTSQGQTVYYEAGFVGISPDTIDGTPIQITKYPPETYMKGDSMMRAPSISHPSDGFTVSSTRATSRTLHLNQSNQDLQPRTETVEGGEITVTVDTEIPSAWESYFETHETFEVDEAATDDYTPESRGTVVATIDLGADDTFTVVSEDIVIRSAN